MLTASLREIFMATSYPIRVISSKRAAMLAVLFSLLFLHLVLALRIFRLALPYEILPLFTAPTLAEQLFQLHFPGAANYFRGPPATL
jgi:hypothetical protein